MPYPILGTPKPAFFDSSGSPLVSGTLSILDPADDTNKASYPTYDDAVALTNANTNPIVLDGRGETTGAAVGLWGLDGEDYKLVLKDSNDDTIWTQDDIQVPIALPHGITSAETTAGVTPSNYSYPPGDDRRYTDLTDWCAVLSQGTPGTLYAGTHTTSAALTITGACEITVVGDATIQASSSIAHLIKATARVSIKGDHLTLDGNGNVTSTIFWASAVMPHLENVTVDDAPHGLVCGTTIDGLSASGCTGSGHLKGVIANDCTKLGLYAKGDTTNGVVWEDCKTTGTTGSVTWSAGRGYLLWCGYFDNCDWFGGDFTGDSGAYCTNAYSCNNASILGGRYHDITRGATLGLDTQNFRVSGVLGESCSEQGIAIDTTDGVGETTGVGVVSNNVLNACGRAIRTTCSYVAVVGNYAYECTDNSGMFVAAGDGTHVWFDGNYCYSTTNGGTFFAFLATENATITVGQNFTNATVSAYTATDAATNLIQWGQGIKSVSAAYDAQLNDDLILVDCTSGTIDIDLPTKASYIHTNKVFSIVKIDTANTCTVSVQGGAGGGTVNGTTSVTIPAEAKWIRYDFVCIDGANGTYICLNTPGTSPYTPTNVSTDRAFDADTVAVAELADVVGTLITDLQTRGIIR